MAAAAAALTGGASPAIPPFRNRRRISRAAAMFARATAS